MEIGPNLESQSDVIIERIFQLMGNVEGNPLQAEVKERGFEYANHLLERARNSSAGGKDRMKAIQALKFLLGFNRIKPQTIGTTQEELDDLYERGYEELPGESE